MQLGLIGLGRMGGSMVRRLMRGSHDLVIFNRTAEKRTSFLSYFDGLLSEVKKVLSEVTD